MVDGLVGSIDWSGFLDNFYKVLGDRQLAHFLNCIVSATHEDSLKLCAVLANNARSLRAETA